MKYSKKIVFGIFILALSGCGESNNEVSKPLDAKVVIEEKVKALILHSEEEFKTRFKDPDSLKIKDRSFSSEIIEILPLRDGKIQSATFKYCFSYNAKNGMGAYTGYKTVELFLAYMKDEVVIKETQEILDYYIDALHFSVLKIAEITGVGGSKCNIEQSSSNTSGVVTDIYKKLYKQN
jgi:hypothetical protein